MKLFLNLCQVGIVLTYGIGRRTHNLYTSMSRHSFTGRTFVKSRKSDAEAEQKLLLCLERKTEIELSAFLGGNLDCATTTPFRIVTRHYASGLVLSIYLLPVEATNSLLIT